MNDLTLLMELSAQFNSTRLKRLCFKWPIQRSLDGQRVGWTTLTCSAIQVRITLPCFRNTAPCGSASKLTLVTRWILTERQFFIRPITAVTVTVAHPRRRDTANRFALKLIASAGHVLARSSRWRVLVRLIRAVKIAEKINMFIYVIISFNNWFNHIWNCLLTQIINNYKSRNEKSESKDNSTLKYKIVKIIQTERREKKKETCRIRSVFRCRCHYAGTGTPATDRR